MRTHPDIGLVITDLLQLARFRLCIIYWMQNASFESAVANPNLLIESIVDVVHTRVIVLAQIDAQNSLQSMLEGSYKTG